MDPLREAVVTAVAVDGAGVVGQWLKFDRLIEILSLFGTQLNLETSIEIPSDEGPTPSPLELLSLLSPLLTLTSALSTSTFSLFWQRLSIMNYTQIEAGRTRDASLFTATISFSSRT